MEFKQHADGSDIYSTFPLTHSSFPIDFIHHQQKFNHFFPVYYTFVVSKVFPLQLRSHSIIIYEIFS